ncbi:CHAP domain-containing protein [Bifidobacterium callimiconis]|uniref:CHAP domain-containing protein n=1 Tax=Bifidobacterium callimiconis TaxID=2306973 RepID=UPI001BDC7162|nr:CHAP domain-containing protein [Bifidobacterium callimiconis]MBT1177358.1 CHAP domain-containing protein [Bifidobacterium callimiconis]
MRHAAHKANAQSTGSASVYRPARPGRAAHTSAVVYANSPLAVVPEVAKMLNEGAPTTRRAIRQAARQKAHKKQFLSASAFALLAATASSFAYASTASSAGLPSASDAVSSLVTDTTDASVATTQSTESSSSTTTLRDTNADVSSATVSRSEARVSADDSAAWSLSSESDALDTSQMSKSLADNPEVAKLMDRDAADLPADFNPNHATGDTGNAYSFSQCTWWAYVRRQQLGLPVGSYFGNGAEWADSARALGYWVDNTPRVGDIMVFQRGQEGSSAVYGHVAIVESINPDGSVVTSECGASLNGQTMSRTFSNVHDFQYIHY